MEIDLKDVLAAYNNVTKKYFGPPSLQLTETDIPFLFVEIVKIGFALFVLDTQDDPDIQTLRKFCRERA
jgi:hypothetical protein